jgi:hypothetical protein
MRVIEIARSAVSGRFVTLRYARRWPGSTVVETYKLTFRPMVGRIPRFVRIHRN